MNGLTAGNQGKSEATPSPPPGTLGGIYYVGDWQVESNVNRIRRGAESIKLEPRVMQVLDFLVHRRGEVVSRDELDAGVWGNAVVGYEALGRAIAQLRKALGDDPRHPSYIETLSKKGYRLIAPVRSAEKTSAVAKPAAAMAAADPGKVSRYVLGAALAAAIVAVVIVLRWPISGVDSTSPVTGPPPPSVVVLPFDNLSSDHSQSYFADGIADNLITDLTKLSGIFVIARHTAFRYRDSDLDVAGLARELGVRYVLQGSVQRHADRLRINAQLTDTSVGSQLWADRYDGELVDIFGLQDRITRNIVAALTVKLTAGERQRLAHRDTGNVAAYEHYLRGREHYYRFARKDNFAARRAFLAAIELDPGFARAYAALALTHRSEVLNGWSRDPEQSLGLALTLAEEALRLNKTLPEAYFAKGMVHAQRKEFFGAIVAAQKSIEINPNYADGHVLLGSVLYRVGRPEEGLKRVERGMRLNPHYPHNYRLCQGEALYMMGSYDKAVEVLKAALDQYPGSEITHVWLAAAYAQAGSPEQAEWEMDQVYAMNPDFSVSALEKASPFQHEGDLDHFLEGIRKAMGIGGTDNSDSGTRSVGTR